MTNEEHMHLVREKYKAAGVVDREEWLARWRALRREEREDFRKNWKTIVLRTASQLLQNSFVGAFMGALVSLVFMKWILFPYLAELAKGCVR